MKILLGPNGKPLLNADGKLIEPCQRLVAIISLGVRTGIPGGFSWQNGSIYCTWRSAEYPNTDPGHDCVTSGAIPSSVTTISGMRAAPCLQDYQGNYIYSSQAPTSRSANISIDYGTASLHATATTPTRVSAIDTTATDEDRETGDVRECSVAQSSLLASASAATHIGLDSYHPGEEYRGHYSVEATANAQATMYSCGCCAQKNIIMRAGSSGSGLVRHSTSLNITRGYGDPGKRLVVSGTWNMTLLPGDTFLETIDAGSATIIVEWVG